MMTPVRPATLASAVAGEHEEVIFRCDPQTGLKAIIAIHNTTIGPAAGGCRHWVYGCDEDAMADALRLSSGMTCKNALADIPFGGGKSVILGRAGHKLTEKELQIFGSWVEELDGRYVAAEDVGMRVADMRVIARRTRYVSGLGSNGIGGDPSPFTARGVYLGMLASVRFRLGTDTLNGIRVAVQGLGNVGFSLCQLLHQAGARLVVTDLDCQRVDRACRNFDAEASTPEEIHRKDVDVFAPCALGGVLNERSVDELVAKVVAGSANNQLAAGSVADQLAARDVLYAPDYVINAAGVISVAQEYLGGTASSWVEDRIMAIPDRLETIFDLSTELGQSTDAVAQRMAEEILSRFSGGSANGTAATLHVG